MTFKEECHGFLDGDRFPNRWAQLALAVCVVLAIPLAAGCVRSAVGTGNAVIDITLVTERVTGPATVEVGVKREDGAPVDKAEVTVRGDMNHAGMKPMIAQTKNVASGKYLTEDFRFTMAGDWLLTAQVTLPNGEKVEKTIDIKGVAGK